MDNAAYEFSTVQAEVKKIAQEVPEQVLGGRSYHAADVHQWVAEVSTQCLKKLKSVANGSAGFKYIVNCSILQKRNAGFHTNSACFWDAERDGECSFSAVDSLAELKLTDGHRVASWLALGLLNWQEASRSAGKTRL